MSTHWGGAALAAALVSAAAHAEAPPVSAFARLPAIEAAVLSPDGSRIAHLAHDDGLDVLIIRNTTDFAVVNALDTSTVKARDVLWASDDVVVLIASDASRVRGVRGGDVEFTAPFGVDLSGGELSVKQLMRQRRPAGIVATAGGGGVFHPNSARIVGLNAATGELLINHFEDNVVDLVAVDPSNDRRRTVGRGASSTYDWVVDSAGEPIIRIDYKEHTDRFSVRTYQNGQWRTLIEETAEIPSLSVYGLDAAGELIVGARMRETGRFGLFVMSLETGEIERPYHLDDTYDVGRVVIDPYTNRVAGVRVDAETPRMVWFDEELAARQREMDGAFGGATAMFASWSRDRRRFLVTIETGARPTVYYLYDVEAKTAEAVGVTHPEAYQADLPERFSILYPARDGVQIPAYLTMADDLPKPAPLVVLPHGGPEARDVAGFDWLAHFIASRGYVVLQPNFRGSWGYGTAWRDAGRGEWGTGVMQHDVSDGVAALVAEGYADPEQVCIVGASYGGYAALAGAAFTPDLYRCAAAIAPVTDLNDMIAFDRGRGVRGSWVVDYWERTMGGDLGAARSRLNAISPARHAENVRAPILLIHGRDDSVVPIEQSRAMERALRNAGKPVELIELRGEDHWLSRAETRLQTLEALDRFLAEHLGD